ncbi:hypothetical protein ABL850_09035 [Variovorax paradoxus]|jgi:predicted TIM-barrel fold metal-dependent hydrolase|uniref:hypothetical protein n=1 Tax=Variovorax paradoxus TaxID=34073 RepID=UPI0004292F00
MRARHLPYESNAVGTRFFNALDLPEALREKLAWKNAARVLRLDLAEPALAA